MQKDISRNFLTIQGWMSNRLKLKGNDLLLFALIYGFSQDGESYFTGSVSYMCNWLNCSKPTVNKSLFNLIELGVIIKKSETIQGVTFNSYKVSLQGVKKLYMGGKETLQGGGKETLQGGGKETLPNNILLDKDTLDNTDNTKEKSEIEISHPSFFDLEKEISEEELLKKQEEERRKKVAPKKEETDPQNIIDIFNSTCKDLPKVRDLTNDRKKVIKARLKEKGFTDLVNMFNKVSKSNYLNGYVKEWKANFDWIMKPSNYQKIIEGVYDNNIKNNPANGKINLINTNR